MAEGLAGVLGREWTATRWTTPGGDAFVRGVFRCVGGHVLVLRAGSGLAGRVDCQRLVGRICSDGW